MRPAMVVLVILGLWAGRAAAQVADVIYVGGDIVTVNRRQPSAEAVAIRDGRIVAVGSRDAVMARRGAETRVIDLGGKTLVPGFIDPHSHFASAMTISEQANCSAPPVGPVRDIPGLVAALKAVREARGIKPGEAIVGYGYDRASLAEGRELTSDDLDGAFPDNPVIVGHVSMHGAVLNSAAMRKVGLSAATATPPGGIIARKPGTNEPAGLVMETAYLPVFAAISAPVSPERELARLKAAQMIYAAAGHHHGAGGRHEPRGARGLAARGGRGGVVSRRRGPAADHRARPDPRREPARLVRDVPRPAEARRA